MSQCGTFFPGDQNQPKWRRLADRVEWEFRKAQNAPTLEADKSSGVRSPAFLFFTFFHFGFAGTPEFPPRRRTCHSPPGEGTNPRQRVSAAPVMGAAV